MTPLFGRDQGLAVLDGVVARALTGQPAFAVVEGEAELMRDRPFVAVAPG